jgi:hypothetical protein
MADALDAARARASEAWRRVATLARATKAAAIAASVAAGVVTDAAMACWYMREGAYVRAARRHASAAAADGWTVL